jgi:hypothetical protein
MRLVALSFKKSRGAGQVKNRDPIAKADNVIETHEHAGEFKEW